MGKIKFAGEKGTVLRSSKNEHVKRPSRLKWLNVLGLLTSGWPTSEV